MGKDNSGVTISSHTPGTPKGEEQTRKQGREPGRDNPMKAFRTARDSTSINPEDMEPIDPRMPYLPPA